MNTNEQRERMAGPAVDVAMASVAGRQHRRLGRPNQDAAAWRRGPGGLVLAVCDGCGSGRRSEIGAALGARLWVQVLTERLALGPVAADELPALGARVLARLAPIAAALGDDLAEVAREHLLFTSLVAVVGADDVVVGALGDGVVVLGDVTEILGPFADNAPPYLAEAWFGAARPWATWTRPRAAIDRLILATDGAEPLVTATVDGPSLDALTADDRIFRNPVALERRLRLLADDAVEVDWDARRTWRRPGLLDDDTTAVCVRWSRS